MRSKLKREVGLAKQSSPTSLPLNSLPPLVLASTSSSSSSSPSCHTTATMTSNEGVNPLRPYYIPPAAGLSSPSDSTPREVASASSSHVFGSSARDLFPDLDYTDYLESSPSLSDWIRDTLDRAVWRYTSTLTAQPFDVAKTILQTYAVPDAEEGQRTLDGQQGSTARRDSLYDDVCSYIGAVRPRS